MIRDYKGQFIAASSKFIPHVASASMAEAMAMREGLELANRLGCNAVIAETDSLETFEACSGQNMWWTEMAAIFADCVDLASSLWSIRYTHCLREANTVAHELARDGFLNKRSCNWDDDPPSFLLNSLTNDVTL